MKKQNLQQTSFLPRPESHRFEHGGSLSLRRRKRRRPLNIKKPVHLVLRSDLAKGKRSLVRNQVMVIRTLTRFSAKFYVKVYERAICGNHLHVLVKASNRRQLQNFFRVFAGQVAQQILQKFPLGEKEEKAFRGGAHPKNHKTFWSQLAYTRLVSWGRDFGNVSRYIVQNLLETAGLIPYRRTKRRISEAGAVPPHPQLRKGGRGIGAE